MTRTDGLRWRGIELRFMIKRTDGKKEKERERERR